MRRGVEISPAAAREWGDNDANRTVRSKLNSDIEALERIYQQRVPARRTSSPTTTAMRPPICSRSGSPP